MIYRMPIPTLTDVQHCMFHPQSESLKETQQRSVEAGSFCLAQLLQ